MARGGPSSACWPGRREGPCAPRNPARPALSLGAPVKTTASGSRSIRGSAGFLAPPNRGGRSLPILGRRLFLLTCFSRGIYHTCRTFANAGHRPTAAPGPSVRRLRLSGKHAWVMRFRASRGRFLLEWPRESGLSSPGGGQDPAAQFRLRAAGPQAGAIGARAWTLSSPTMRSNSSGSFAFALASSTATIPRRASSASE